MCLHPQASLLPPRVTYILADPVAVKVRQLIGPREDAYPAPQEVHRSRATFIKPPSMYEMLNIFGVNIVTAEVRFISITMLLAKWLITTSRVSTTAATARQYKAHSQSATTAWSGIQASHSRRCCSIRPIGKAKTPLRSRSPSMLLPQYVPLNSLWPESLTLHSVCFECTQDRR